MNKNSSLKKQQSNVRWLLIKKIYHDFLPSPRRGSHVKSDKTHTQSSRYTPYSLYYSVLFIYFCLRMVILFILLPTILLLTSLHRLTLSLHLLSRCCQRRSKYRRTKEGRIIPLVIKNSLWNGMFVDDKGVIVQIWRSCV